MGVLTVEVPNKTYDVVIEQNVYERLQTDYASLLNERIASELSQTSSSTKRTVTR